MHTLTPTLGGLKSTLHLTPVPIWFFIVSTLSSSFIHSTQYANTNIVIPLHSHHLIQMS